MRHHCKLLRPWLAPVLVFGLTLAGYAAIPTPEKLLPDDTLLVVTAPDFARLRAIWQKLPQRRLWNDPAMRPFRENLINKLNEQLVKPLETELDVKFDDYTNLLQGQLTFALTQNGWQGAPEQAPGVLLLADTKDRGNQLKKNLANLRKKWVDSGKPIKTTKIHEYEFTTLPVSSNDVPKTLGKFFHPAPEVHELGEENAPKPASPEQQLVIGQIESLLVIGNSTQPIEKVVARITGGTVPPLADVALYQADHAALFRDAPLYGWMNLKAFIDVFLRKLSEKKDNPEAPNPFELKPERILGALGLNGLRTLAFNFQQSNDGSLLQLFIGAPEASRQGILKILAGEPRECRPPAFVPADAVKFQR